MPVVVMTRWPCTVTASAPPAHIALSTAWMSCWCTTIGLTSPSVDAISSSGASASTTVTPAPSTASRPAMSSSVSARFW